jgi:hypothetical protein
MTGFLIALIGASIRSQKLDKSLTLRIFVAEALGEFYVLEDVSYPWEGQPPKLS